MSETLCGSSHHITLAVMAAGKASRFGGNKQMADLCGKPLIAHSIASAVGSCANEVIVVSREDLPFSTGRAEVIHCEGLLSDSIRKAVEWSRGRSCALLIHLGDQPFVSSAMLDRLISTHSASPMEMACFVRESRPVNPAIFPSPLFGSLYDLRGDRGAQQLLAEKAVMLLPESEMDLDDIDTQEDLEEARRRLCGR
ncbi:MAG: nucleotidyltransferase family protein [Methanomassiliicoccales archaeon]